MSHTLFNTQSALFAALAADSGIQTLLGSPARLYDHVPPGAGFPYVEMGAVHAQSYDTKTETGLEQIVTFNIWSRYRGSKEAKDILQAMYDVLHRATLSVSGDIALLCVFHSAALVLLDDGLTTHATTQFIVRTQES